MYGWPESGLKHRTWEMISRLGANRGDPWLLGSDFNEILYDSDKRGGAACEAKYMSDFRDCLDFNGLRELDSKGSKYTWSNKCTEGLIEEKLDRFVVNSSWRASFPNVSVENLI